MKQAIKWSYCIWCDKSTSLSSLKTVRFVELSSHISSCIEDLSEILSAYFSGEENLFSGLKHMSVMWNHEGEKDSTKQLNEFPNIVPLWCFLGYFGSTKRTGASLKICWSLKWYASIHVWHNIWQREITSENLHGTARFHQFWRQSKDCDAGNQLSCVESRIPSKQHPGLSHPVDF